MTKAELQKIRDYKVIKYNDLIQKTRHQLSMQEQKIVLYLISKIKPGDTELTDYKFDVAEFCEICGIILKIPETTPSETDAPEVAPASAEADDLEAAVPAIPIVESEEGA